MENIKVTVRYDIYDHIESYLSSSYSHNERNGKHLIGHVKGASGILIIHSSLRVRGNPQEQYGLEHERQ